MCTIAILQTTNQEAVSVCLKTTHPDTVSHILLWTKAAVSSPMNRWHQSSTTCKPSNKVNQTHLHVYHPSFIPRFLQSYSQTSFPDLIPRLPKFHLLKSKSHSQLGSLDGHIAGENGSGGGDAPTWSALRPHRWPPLAPCWPIASTVAHYSPAGCPTTLQYCGEDPLEERYRSVNGATTVKSWNHAEEEFLCALCGWSVTCSVTVSLWVGGSVS